MNFVGVDIGGTSVKVGIVSSAGVMLARSQQDIEDRSPEAIVGIAVNLARQCATEANVEWTDIAGLGVGCPGQVSNGVLVAAANFATWDHVPLELMLHERLHVPSVLVNDADAAVAAEHWVGTASNVKNFVMLSTFHTSISVWITLYIDRWLLWYVALGTGVGFGVVNDDKIVAGGTGMIEGGHVVGSLTTSLSQLKVDSITAKDVFDAADAGDQVSKAIIEEVAEYLGFACVNFCRTLDPEMIVLSGGLAEAGEAFIQQIRDAYTKYTWTKLPNPVIIEKASVGYDCGIIGAAAFAFKANKTN
ncbi:hypothetical protein DYB25_002016 [Aphanomyces astaci]|uniref:Glucokinase n=1 Tax=Aphanomyces astaci TaxID=112090 RepID=A0A397EFT9_APHAT|nr:hypothetical protein DYB36_004897 [Aphanomyces astaci]RHY20836.1 hypothetical protein DYB25_002016 [Aphanomyces astaci]RHY84460.1 hypothetical protein DYB31_005689 [Aphanomyces astaci]RHZ09015.1 hypothetical protein DYB26_004892 [Aphanomyces astaci]